MLSLKVRLPSGQLITLKFKPDTSLQTVISEIVKTHKLPRHSQDYFLYSNQFPKKWLDPTATLEQVTDILEHELKLVSRFLIVKVELLGTSFALGSNRSINENASGEVVLNDGREVISTLFVLVDVDAPLRLTFNFVARKFQIEDCNSFALYSPNSRIFSLEIESIE
jgi:hypothetical protein